MKNRRHEVPVEPLPESRWDRIERRLLDARGVDKEAALFDGLRRPRAGRLVLATALVGAALGGMLIMAVRDGKPASPAVADLPSGAGQGPAPTVIVTPSDSGSTLAVGDAECAVGPGSVVSSRVAADGAVTLELARGLVDCDVEPRPGRAPFVVLAADVTVTVVGTRFTVERGADVRVAVLRGKVRVASAGRDDTQLAAGESWRAVPGGAVAIGPTVPARADTPQQEPQPQRPQLQPQSPEAVDPRDAGAEAPAGPSSLEGAEAVADTDPMEAARQYREIGKGRDADAQLSLYRLARLELAQGRVDAAITASLDYERKFPAGEHLDEMLWLRVVGHCTSYRSTAASEAARAYLRRFPSGPHAAAAQQPSVCLAAP